MYIITYTRICTCISLIHVHVFLNQINSCKEMATHKIHVECNSNTLPHYIVNGH